MWQQIIGIIAALGLAALLARQFYQGLARNKAAHLKFFDEAKHLLDDPLVAPGEAAGSYQMTGRYRGHFVQVKAIPDTLPLRKLPSQWLMVTIPGELHIKSTFDLMMRPTGPTTFSNFDHLPVTIDRPPDFPEQAVVRTDDPDHLIPRHIIAPHLEPFFGPRAKELLISPKGIRMVIQMAEADRARYGVFRQADFGETALDPALLRDILDRLIALRSAIVNWRSTST